MTDQIPPEIDDLARLVALEHMVTTLWSMFAMREAAQNGMAAEDVAKGLASGLIGTMVEADMPADLRAIVIGHARKALAKTVGDCRIADELGLSRS